MEITTSENMKKFLEAVSKNDGLYGKFVDATKEDLIAMAKALGIELTEADFDKKSELDEDELEAVAGGQSCYCAMSGGGEYSSKGGGDCRCVCVLADTAMTNGINIRLPIESKPRRTG